MKSWYNGQSRGVSRGLIYEFLVRKLLEDNDFFIRRGLNYQVKKDALWCIPDFILPDYKRPKVVIFVSHYETPSNSQYMFYETIEELFECKINYGNRVICVNLIFGRKDGWTSWLLQGFRELFDYCLFPDEGKITYYVDILRKLENYNTYEGFLKNFQFLLRKNSEFMAMARVLGQTLLALIKRGKSKARYFDLWNSERSFHNSIDMYEQRENIKNLFPNQINRLPFTGKVESKSVLIDHCPNNRLQRIMIYELHHPKIIDQKIRFLLKITNNLLADEDRIANILKNCSKNPRVYGFDGPGNWMLLLLIEFAGLKRNSLRNEVNRMTLEKGIKNLIPYLYYNKELTLVQARFLSRVLLNHLFARLKDANTSFEELTENIKHRIIERYRSTLLRYHPKRKSLIRTRLEKSKTIRGLIRGFPEKKYVFAETLFRDLLPNLKGYQGKVGRLFQIVCNPESSVYIHSKQAIKSSVQHRSSEQSGIARVLRYRYVDGKITENPKIKGLIFIPIGYWRHHDLLRLCMSGMKVFPLGNEIIRHLEEKILGN